MDDDRVKNLALEVVKDAIPEHIDSCPIGRKFDTTMAGIKGALSLWGAIIALIGLIGLGVNIYASLKPTYNDKAVQQTTVSKSVKDEIPEMF